MPEEEFSSEQPVRLSDAVPTDPALTQPESLVPQMSQKLSDYLNSNIPESSLLEDQNSDLTYNPQSSIVSMMEDVQMNGLNAETDLFKSGKAVMGDFRNPNIQHQFYERYAEHGKFEELGFNPFRDNESLYNENSNIFNEMGRAKNQVWELTKLGFKDAMGFGDLSDVDVAADYERAMAIGSSSKGGATGFTSNLFLNSGYTLGIMGELAAEELAMLGAEALLGAATVGSGGAASGGTLPAMSLIGARMAARAARAFGKVGKAMKHGLKLQKKLDSFKDVNKARAAFKGYAVKGVKFLNPLENTTDLYRNWGKVDNLHRLQKVGKTFGAFYRDVRNAKLAYGEGALEGGMTQLKMERELLHAFETENGRPPEREEAIKIKQTALLAGERVSMYNIPAILYSNKLTFDGLVRGKYKNLRSSLLKGRNGKIIFNPKKGVSEAYTRAKDGFFKAKWQYIQNPKLIVANAGRYGQANIAEGLQETAQETIAGTAEDYYTAQYKGDAFKGALYAAAAENFGKQFSTQGLETFMSGFLMGGMVSPVSRFAGGLMHSKEFFTEQKMRFTDSAAYDKQKEERSQALEEDIKILNDFYEDPKAYLSPDLMNLVQQKEFLTAMKQAEAEGDKKTFYDMKDTSGFKHVATALRYGRLGTHIQALEEQRNLTAEEVDEEYKMNHGEYQAALDVAIDRARQVEKRYNFALERYPNPHDPSQYPKDPEKAKLAEIRKIAWDNAIEEMIFNQYSFDRALERQTSILAGASKNTGLKELAYSDFNLLFDLKSSQVTIESLDTQIETLENIEGSVPKELSELKKKRKALNSFADGLTSAMSSNAAKVEELSPSDYERLKKSYENYLQLLAEESGSNLTSDKLEESLDEVIDYHLLGKRSNAANTAVNSLLDPKTFVKEFERQENISKAIHAARKKEIENSLKEFLKLKDTDAMLQDLFEAGLFITPKDLNILKESGAMPTVYRVDSNGNVQDEAPMTKEDYKKAVTIIKNYYKSLTGVEIPEKKLDVYAVKARDKFDGDKRTYDDLAKQFGFDTQSEVKLEVVLTAIINSEYATEQEVALAKKLLELADPNEIVTFSDTESSSGSYSNTDQQTIIDARYSASEFKEGKNGNPIEQVILQQELLRRTVESLETDDAFRNEMQVLYDKSVAVYRQTIADKDGILYGLSSLEEFVSAAMTNSRFQTFLATVEADSSRPTPSKWKQFVNLVLDNISKIFNSKIDGTALNGALNAITTKMNSFDEGSTNVVNLDVVSSETSVEDLVKHHPTLAKKILTLFKAQNEETGKTLLPGAAEMEDKEIYDSKEFAKYLKNPWPKKDEAIIDYNNKKEEDVSKDDVDTSTADPFSETDVSDSEFADFEEDSASVSDKRIRIIGVKIKQGQGKLDQLTEKEKQMYADSSIAQRVDDFLKEVALSEEEVTSSSAEIITDKMAKELRDLGYSQAFIDNPNNGMTPAKAAMYIQEGLTRVERDEIENGPEFFYEDIEQSPAAKALAKRVQAEMDAIDTYEDLKAFEASLLANIADHSEGFAPGLMSGATLVKMVEKKADELAFTVNFADIEVGEVLMLNNKNLTQVRVMAKEKDALTLRYENSRKPYKEPIKKSEVKDKIKYRYNTALASRELSQVQMDKGEAAIAAQALREFAEEIDMEAANKSDEAAKTKTKEEIDNDILDKLCK